MKIKFISGLRDPEAKLGLLDGIKTKPTMPLSKMTESSQFRSQAMVFASSSTGNRPFVVTEEVGYNFKKTFREPREKFTGNKGNGNLCNRCGGQPHSSKPCSALNKKCNTCEKVGHFSKMCRRKKPSLSQVSLTSTTTSARKRVSCLVKHHPKWRWECTIHGKTCLKCRLHGSTLQ